MIAGRFKSPPGQYLCNVCGAANLDPRTGFDRESGACAACGAVVRIRAIVHHLSLALHGESLPVPAWPAKMYLSVIGISDWRRLVEAFRGKIGYALTQFDDEVREGEPFLDVTKPPPEFEGYADAVVCSEVLEHVVPPVDLAFAGIYRMLKPGGTLVLTVPYTTEPHTVEHFPELNDWRLGDNNGSRTLYNATRDGRLQVFDDLTFHGGGSSVLEMRVFGRDDLIARLRAAGFDSVREERADVPEFGIVFPQAWSLPLVVRKN